MNLNKNTKQNVTNLSELVAFGAIANLGNSFIEIYNKSIIAADGNTIFKIRDFIRTDFLCRT